MTTRMRFHHEYLIAGLWVLAALVQAVSVSIMFLRAEPISGWMTLGSLFIICGAIWSLTKVSKL